MDDAPRAPNGRPLLSAVEWSLTLATFAGAIAVLTFNLGLYVVNAPRAISA